MALCYGNPRSSCKNSTYTGCSINPQMTKTNSKELFLSVPQIPQEPPFTQTHTPILPTGAVLWAALWPHPRSVYLRLVWNKVCNRRALSPRESWKGQGTQVTALVLLILATIGTKAGSPRPQVWLFGVQGSLSCPCQHWPPLLDGGGRSLLRKARVAQDRAQVGQERLKTTPELGLTDDSPKPTCPCQVGPLSPKSTGTNSLPEPQSRRTWARWLGTGRWVCCDRR
jgi:hypothetical protein